MPAIPAAHNLAGDLLVSHLMFYWPLWSDFQRVRAHIDGPLPDPAGGPYIFCATHTSWWDGHLSKMVNDVLLRRRLRSYAMMEEAQLRRYRFFSWVGAFSVQRGEAAETARTLQYAAGLLAGQPDRALWIYPQGRIVHQDVRPIQVFPGVARIVQLAGGATLVPVAFRYEFFGAQRPEALIWLGTPRYVPGDTGEDQIVADLKAGMTAAADALRAVVISGQRNHLLTLMRGSPGLDQVFDATFGRLLRP